VNAHAGQIRPRVLLADPDVPTRAGLRIVLEAGGLAVAGEADDVAAAVRLAAAERPDLALVAAELPGGGLEAIRHIAAEVPGTRLIVLTGHPGGEELVDAVLAGAVGYLSRDTGLERLPAILRAVLAGEVALPRRHSRTLVEALRGRDARRALVAERTGVALTDREWEVLELLAGERSTGEIAHRLGISVVTARRHISSLVGKLGVDDRSGAIELMRSRSSE
jgi:NarL family two-component system response regulator LiaR